MPVVIVYTKYDLFVAANEFDILNNLENVKDMDEPAVDAALHREARVSFDDMCVMTFKKGHPDDIPPYTRVSGKVRGLVLEFQSQ